MIYSAPFKKKLSSKLQKDSQSFGVDPAPVYPPPPDVGITRLLLALGLGLG